MAPGSRTPPFPAPGSGHAAAVRPGPNGLTGSPRAVPRASGVCGAIGGAGGRGAGAGKDRARRAAPRGGGTLWPPSSPPPLRASFGLRGDVSPSQVSVASSGSASGPDPSKLRSLKRLPGCRKNFVGSSLREDGREGGIWKAWKSVHPCKILQASLELRERGSSQVF